MAGSNFGLPYGMVVVNIVICVPSGFVERGRSIFVIYWIFPGVFRKSYYRI